MKVVIAPDSFKESLSASAVAAAIADGVLKVCPDAQVDLCPMADGGEGTVEAMVAATGGRFVSADVFDPLGQPIRAKFGLLGLNDSAMLPGEVGLTAAGIAASGDGISGAIAVIESAAASGLMLVPPDKRDPMRTTTFGTGQLILAALDAGARQIILGIGGSATVDGGTGCAQALGVEFFDANGESCICGLAGGALEGIAQIDLSGLDPRIDEITIRVACDVTNPLTGPNGAAGIYGPQKGATPEQVEKLEAGLTHLAGLIRQYSGCDISDMPSAGAAGGLAGGLVAFTGATLENGGRLIAETLRLPQRLRGADLCFTGEGRIDAQSRFGKVPVRVADMAAQEAVPTICIAGMVADDAPAELFREIHSLVADDVTTNAAMSEPEKYLSAHGAQAMKKFIS